MKIKEIRAMRLRRPPREGPRTPPRRPSWAEDAEVANPMSRYPKYKRHRSSWRPKWEGVWVKVTAEDGTWGLGMTSYGRPVAAIIEDHFAPLLVEENCFAIEKLWDMMFRMSKPYGSMGLTSCAISGVDLALWDLAGKLKGQPVYELIGGPVRDRIFAYATGNDTDWQLELGFKAAKLACPYGPVDGLWGLKENERLVARTRELVGDDVEIMLDCYMAFDVDYTIRLAQRLRSYRLKWIEEYLIPEDIAGHVEVRKAVNWVSLAGSECVKICHMAEAAGYAARDWIWIRRLRILQRRRGVSIAHRPGIGLRASGWMWRPRLSRSRKSWYMRRWISPMCALRTGPIRRTF